MSNISYEAKRAYFARIRRKNYVASLRLEGFDVREHAADEKLPSRAEALAIHKCKATA